MLQCHLSSWLLNSAIWDVALEKCHLHVCLITPVWLDLPLKARRRRQSHVESFAGWSRESLLFMSEIIEVTGLMRHETAECQWSSGFILLLMLNSSIWTYIICNTVMVQQEDYCLCKKHEEARHCRQSRFSSNILTDIQRRVDGCEGRQRSKSCRQPKINQGQTKIQTRGRPQGKRKDGATWVTKQTGQVRWGHVDTGQGGDRELQKAKDVNGGETHT